jgi:hypothetical protein
VAGVAVKKTGKYLNPLYLGWFLTIVGAGLLTTLRADSHFANAVGFQLVVGSGVGIVYVTSLFPILASIPVTQTAPAMALYVFSRNFGYVSPSLLPDPPISFGFANDLPGPGLDLGCHRRRCHHPE